MKDKVIVIESITCSDESLVNYQVYISLDTIWDEGPFKL